MRAGLGLVIYLLRSYTGRLGCLGRAPTDEAKGPLRALRREGLKIIVKDREYYHFISTTSVTRTYSKHLVQHTSCGWLLHSAFCCATHLHNNA